tara:strand:+ start:3738 stop:4331 length:594 start_codon:yes stop_codon:yes gene_type:complete
MRKIIFTDSILIDYFNDDDFNNFKKQIFTILEEKKQNNFTVKKSNLGGFQTENISSDISKYNLGIEKILMNKIINMLKNSYTFNEVELSLHEMWINENNKGDFNSPHIHPGSDFSGVLYIKTSEKSGDVAFIRNDKCPSMGNHEQIFNDTDFITESKITPENKMIIIFPSYMQHIVYPNLEKDSRISISFNIRLQNG